MVLNLKLDTIIIFVQNIEKLKGFYVNILKLEIIEETKEEWLLLKAGKCNIGLHKIGQEYLENEKEFKFDNNTKIVFEMEDDISNVREYLISKDVIIKDIMNWKGYPYLLCDGEDPEGNIFQLKTKK